MKIEDLKNYLELAGALIIGIVALILLIKMLFKRVDKNGNGKIEKEEVTDADLEFTKQMLKESIQTIATGMLTIGGMTSKNAYSMLLNEAKKSKEIFEKEEAKKEDKESA